MWTGSNRSPYLYYRFPFKCVSFTLTNPKSVIFASLSPPILRRALENEFVGMWVPLAEQNSDILTRGETWRPPSPNKAWPTVSPKCEMWSSPPDPVRGPYGRSEKDAKKKGFQGRKKQVNSKELKKPKVGRKEKGVGTEVWLSSCWPLVHLAEYHCVQGTLGAFWKK